MEVYKRRQLLVFQDAIGVSEGYKPIWDNLLFKSGITQAETRVVVRSTYQFIKGKAHLEWKKTRKQPGFNTDPAMQSKLRGWVKSCIEQHQPDLIVCFDPALLFMLNRDWSQATLDKLRGGLYIEMGIPWVVTLPLTAHHNKAKAKDIAKLNEGFTEKGEFNDYNKELDYADLESKDDSDEDSQEDLDEKARMEWHEPIVIPFGKIMLSYDFAKVGRLLGRIPRDKQIA